MRGDTRGIVVSESLARLRWPGEDPVGNLLRPGSDDLTVVGVSGSARLVSPEDSDAVEIYQFAAGGDNAVDGGAGTDAAPTRRAGPLGRRYREDHRPRLVPEVQLMKSAFQGKFQIGGIERAWRWLCWGWSRCCWRARASWGWWGTLFRSGPRRSASGWLSAHGPGMSCASCCGNSRFRFLAGLAGGVGGAVALSQGPAGQLLYGVSNLDPIAYVSGHCSFRRSQSWWPRYGRRAARCVSIPCALFAMNSQGRSLTKVGSNRGFLSDNALTGADGSFLESKM